MWITVARRRRRARIADVGGDLHRRPGGVRLGIGDEQAAAGDPVGEHLVAEVDGRLHDQPDAAIEAAIGVEVELLERLGPGDRIVAIVEPDEEVVGGAEAQMRSQVDREGQIAAEMAGDGAAVHLHQGDVHRRLDAQHHRLAAPSAGAPEALGVEGDALPLIVDDARLDPRRVRQGHLRGADVTLQQPHPLSKAMEFLSFVEVAGDVTASSLS